MENTSKTRNGADPVARTSVSGEQYDLQMGDMKQNKKKHELGQYK